MLTVKTFLTCFAAILLTLPGFAQVPDRMSYQAVIRNSSDQLVVNTNVGMRISIQKMLFAIPPNPPTYEDVYIETQTPETNANGLVTLKIGAGVVKEGDFSEIDWDNGYYFVYTETDPEGGTNYTITGRSQLLSVPYALHAKTSETIAGGIEETDPSVPVGTSEGEMQYWDGSEWVTVSPGIEGQFLSLSNRKPVWVTLVNVSVLAQTDVHNPITGEVWMDRNLGASQVATSSNDAKAYGDLYQWGRSSDGHEKRTSGTTSRLSNSNTPGHGDFIVNPSFPWLWRSPQNDNLWQGLYSINNPCPSGYRLPTSAEWNAERESWSSNNAAGAFASPLKLTVGGARHSDGSLNDIGSRGRYWSSTISIVSSHMTLVLKFSSSGAILDNARRANGYSVRCIKD